jgi:DNA-directed RNA polymerase subunit RPC12/RpoP
MANVNAICTSCNKTVEVDNTKDAWVCPYCSTPFIVSKAINKYKSQHKDIARKVKAVKKHSTDFVVTDGVLTEYKGNSENVTIPGEVHKIGNHVFENNTTLKNITIHDKVNTIGAYAFRGCTALEEINLPDSINSIDIWAFRGCTSLKSVVSASYEVYIGLSFC